MNGRPLAVLVLVLVCLHAGPALSATYNMARSGPTTWQMPGGATYGFAAAQAFKRFSGPISAIIAAGQVIEALKPLVMDELQAQVAFRPAGRAPAPLPTQPLQAKYFLGGLAMPSAGYDSPAAACTQGGAYHDAAYNVPGLHQWTFVAPMGCQFSAPPDTHVYGANIIESVQAAPQGYHTDTVARQYVLDPPGLPQSFFFPPDLEATVIPQNQQLIPSAWDPDMEPSYSPKSPYSTSSETHDTWTREGSDQFGNPFRERVKAMPDGGLQWESRVQGEDQTTGQTMTKVDSVTTNRNGTVIDVFSRTFPGELTQTAPVATTLPTTVPAPTTTDLPTTVPTSSPTTQPLPQEGTQPATNTLPVPFVQPGNVAVDPVPIPKAPGSGSCNCALEFKAPIAPTFLDSLKQGYNGLLGSPFIQALKLSVNTSGECQPLRFDFSSAGVFSALGAPQTDSHCQILNQIKSVFGLICMVLYSLTALYIVLEA